MAAPCQSCQCEAVCKSGNQCTRAAKVIHQDKKVCLFHYNILTLKDEECCICMEYMKRSSSMKLSCGHYFHKKCLIKWGEQDKDTCPLCRQPMDVDSLMKINKTTLDYLGMLIYSLPTEQRRTMMFNVMSTINMTFTTFIPTPLPTQLPMPQLHINIPNVNPPETIPESQQDPYS